MKTSPLFAALCPGLAGALLLGGAACRSARIDQHQALLKQYEVYWNTGNTGGVEAVLHPDYELRYAPEFKPSVKGIAAFREEMVRMHALSFALAMDEVVYSPSTITLRWTCRATLPDPTGGAAKLVQAKGLSLIHLKNGKIADEWIAYDRKDWMEQLGFELKPK